MPVTNLQSVISTPVSRDGGRGQVGNRSLGPLWAFGLWKTWAVQRSAQMLGPAGGTELAAGSALAGMRRRGRLRELRAQRRRWLYHICCLAGVA
jgi:hypothetical protein